MKKWIFCVSLLLFTGTVNATYIAASNDCPGDAGCDPTVSDSYRFDIRISSTDNLTWTLKLNNTSTPAGPLIDMFALNMNAVLGTDFTVANFDPASWTFDTPTGGAIQFDYIGERGDPSSRLGSGDSLTFDFIFGTATNYTVWTNTFADLGVGLGGGNDLGQFLVSFQQLGITGEDSDLIGDSWQFVYDPPPEQIPEPMPLALMGIGLVGLGFTRRAIKKNEQSMIDMRM